MKNLYLIILITIASSLFINAQDSKRSEAYNLFKAGKLEQAKQLIDEVCYNPTTKNHPKSWYFKALIYKELAKTKDFASACDLEDIAYKAVIESRRLDAKGLFVTENLNELLSLSSIFIKNGSVLYNNAIKNDDIKTYRQSLREFDNFFASLVSLDKDSMQVIEFLQKNNIPYQDILVFAAYAAYKSGNNNKAKHYYSRLAILPAEQLNSNLESYPYAFVIYSDILSKENKHNKAIDVINKALSVWPQDKKLAIAEIKIYQNAGKTDELTAKYEKAIVNDPENVELMIALSEKYDIIYQGFMKNNDMINATKYREEAAETYKRAIALKPSDRQQLYNLHYNLGILYYNPAVDLYQKYTKTKDEQGRKKIEEQYIPLFKKAISAFEDAYQLNSTNKELIDMMTRIYLILEDMDKASEMKEKYKSLE